MSTIHDVANKAGVSVATVSRVMNGKHNVRPKTVEAVQRAIKELNYMPNISARNLRKNESRVILVVARNFTNPFYAHLVSGINEVVGAAGYNLMMCKNNGDIKETVKYFQMIEERAVDGIIMLNCTSDDIWMKSFFGKYPVVQCCEYVESFQFPKVYLDHELTGYSATKYLIEQGHRKIVYVGADNNHSSTIGRRAGYYRAMLEAGLADQIREFSVDADYSFKRSVDCAKEIMKQPDLPTAVFCVSDIVALGIVLGARDLGYDVPKNLSVIGVDDVDYTTMWHPFLSTMRIPCEEIGRESAELLLKCLKGETEIIEDIKLETELVIRESTAPPQK